MPAEHDSTRTDSVFDRDVAAYDAWYDSPDGSAIFANELDALRPLLPATAHPQLEIGMGTGRFASSLGIHYGVDPARSALDLAASRGIHVACGTGEQLPFRGDVFGTVLFVVSLCFVMDPQAALIEARRVLKPDGALVLGTLPAEGAWAQHYMALAARGNPYYQSARFFSRPQLLTLLETSGFRVTHRRTALFTEPGSPARHEQASDGDDLRAGFLAILARPRQDT